jgi:hypothetical protein
LRGKSRGIEVSVVPLDQKVSNKPPPHKKKLRHAGVAGDWEADQSPSFTPPEPLQIARNMVSKVMEKYPDPYEAYISSHDVVRDLYDDLCPEARRVFDSGDYSREK